MDKRRIFSALALLVLATCGGREPTGQVVATVANHEITTAQVNHELWAMGVVGKPDRSAIEAAVEALVARRILMTAAEERKIDRQPATRLQQNRAREMVLLQQLTDTIRSGTDAPADVEVRAFVNAHPATFSQRHVFILDQYVISDNSEQTTKALMKLTTMPQVEAWLAQRKIPFNRTIGALDALDLGAEKSDRIAALPAGEVIITPAAGGLRISQVRETVILPLTEASALAVAREMLLRQRAQELTETKLKEIVAAGRAQVRYNTEYLPSSETLIVAK